MHAIVELVAHTFIEELGDQLDAVYLFGSLAGDYFQPGESDVNMLLVVADGTTLHPIRTAFLPIWNEHGSQLRRAPMVAERSVFKKHLQLNPLFGMHLANEAMQLFGPSDLLEGHPIAGPRDAFARLSYEAMQASAAIAPQLLAEATGAERLAQLRRLVRRITREPVPEGVPPEKLLADVQDFLGQMMETSSISRWSGGKRPTTSLLLPGLESTYKELGNIVMSFAFISREQITAVDWKQLSSQLKKHYAGLKIVTSTQLHLIAELIIPQAVALQQFQHEWGVGILNAVKLSNSQVLRHAARFPSDLLVDALPNAYLVSEDEAIGKVIHDFQNRILNIHLEHELLGRMRKVEQHPAPEAQFDREAPHQHRIDAIVKHLNSWITYYMDYSTIDA